MNEYGADLAYIHDVGFGSFASNAAPGLLSILRQCGIRSGLVVDLGCGSGIWARELVRAGYRVHGIDQSADMIALARVKAPSGRFSVASLFDARLPQCKAITSLGEAINYWSGASSGLPGIRRLFRRVFKALVSGGAFIFDAYLPRGRNQPLPPRRYFEGDGWTALVEVQEDDARSILTRRITSFRRVNGQDLYRRSIETHRLWLGDASMLAAELRQAGFRARPMRQYGAYRLPTRKVAYLARKE